MKETMTYKESGVDYDAMDPFKRQAQLAGRETAENIERFGLSELEMSRGESVYLVETDDSFLAHVNEGLGTKNLVADEMWRKTTITKSYYSKIAQDTVAMIVNDMITLGALPISVAMHLAVENANWFNDKQRCDALIEGWKNACNLARCSWGGGETPALRGIIVPGTTLLSGSGIGIIKPKKRFIAGNIQFTDAIVLIGSSGVHANGLSMMRDIGEKLPEGYLTKLSDGRTYGDTLLDPTHIYVGFIEECLNQGVDIHYTVNITGHGWRKLMRARQPFTYVIEHLPKQLPIFDFIQKWGPVNDEQAYGTFNMGAGFAIYMPESEVEKIIKIAAHFKFDAWRAGYIAKSEEKKVIIKPKGLEYSEETLGVR